MLHHATPERNELVKTIIKTSWFLFIIFAQNTAKQKQAWENNRCHILAQRTSNSNKMNKLITNRNLIIVNFVIVSFFILIWLINFYNIDFVLIGFFREILTIPFLFAQLVFLVIGIKYLIKNQKNSLTIISVLSLAICSIITIGTFF